ncbi:hypothetical protein [Streptomyces sp. NPDC087270]|uniref:hypothetical protein n=1 Tax=Streptomyces sp. NPDC087270 TaxID=3365774 RepID=UPI003801F15A
MPSNGQHPAVPIDCHIDQARDCFRDFVTTYAPTDVHTTDVYLEPLLAGWLHTGPGIESTAGAYDHFLQAVLDITDAILTGTLCLDYAGPDAPPYPRRLIGLQDPRAGANVLSRMGYDCLVHDTLEGRRAEDVRFVVKTTRICRL